jgi:hypothetical protein
LFDEIAGEGIWVAGLISGWGFSGHGVAKFVQADESGDAATIDALDAPIQDLFGAVKRNIGAGLGAAAEIDEGAGAADADDFGGDGFGVGGERGALEVGILEELEK